MEQTKKVAKEQKNEPVIYTINVTASRIKGEKNGEKYDFLSFNTVNKKGKRARIKFTKDCPNVPEEEGRYKLIIDKRFINEDKSMKYLTYWVSVINDYYSLDRKENTEDLPFDLDDELDF